MADVGLVGFPNAGKSPLNSTFAAKPKSPTTHSPPWFPILELSNTAIQGLLSWLIFSIIEDAHLGKGLGTRFLRHIERNSLLLFMIPCDSQDIQKEYEILSSLVHQFNPELTGKQFCWPILKRTLPNPEWKRSDSINLQKIFPAYLYLMILPIRDWRSRKASSGKISEYVRKVYLIDIQLFLAHLL
ncbi:MAG: 50S ribosome-binding GTPase [Saprospiraceae bacterium]|nr:50S ribosome-binding GTPase [Candidatus Vicinibacter affinis]